MFVWLPQVAMIEDFPSGGEEFRYARAGSFFPQGTPFNQNRTWSGLCVERYNSAYEAPSLWIAKENYGAQEV